MTPLPLKMNLGIDTSGVRLRDGCRCLVLIHVKRTTHSTMRSSFSCNHLGWENAWWTCPVDRRRLISDFSWSLKKFWIFLIFSFIHQNSRTDWSRKSWCCHHLQQKLCCGLSMDRLPNRNSRQNFQLKRPTSDTVNLKSFISFSGGTHLKHFSLFLFKSDFAWCGKPGR